MKMSEQISEIAKALAEAQVKMKPAEKDSINPHFKSKHSSLCAVWEAAAPIMEQGICILQDAVTTDKGISVETTLIHSSGQWFQFGPLTIPITKMDAQACGSAISYCKRYALCSAVGIVSGDVDDDGEAAMQRGLNKSTGEIYKKESGKEPLSHDQMMLIDSFDLSKEELEKIYAFYKVPSIGALSPEQADHAIHYLKKKRENEQKKSDESGI